MPWKAIRTCPPDTSQAIPFCPTGTDAATTAWQRQLVQGSHFHICHFLHPSIQATPALTPAHPAPSHPGRQGRPHIHDQGLWSWRKACCWRRPPRQGWWGRPFSGLWPCPTHFLEGSVLGSPEVLLGPKQMTDVRMPECEALGCGCPVPKIGDTSLAQRLEVHPGPAAWGWRSGAAGEGLSL